VARKIEAIIQDLAIHQMLTGQEYHQEEYTINGQGHSKKTGAYHQLKTNQGMARRHYPQNTEAIDDINTEGEEKAKISGAQAINSILAKAEYRQTEKEKSGKNREAQDLHTAFISLSHSNRFVGGRFAHMGKSFPEGRCGTDSLIVAVCAWHLA
jgi:hypothetical protein